MNYEQMSDFEINKAVAEALGFTLHYSGADTAQAKNGNMTQLLDYCNNPSDAWPIIVDNAMHIYPEHQTKNWIAYAYTETNFLVGKNDNPLRAAMIVFLMTQESK